MHLGDYATKRTEVECFCAEHLPDKDVRVFTLTKDDLTDWGDLQRVRFNKGWIMGIRYLTENARNNADGNYPNVGADWDIEDR
jgi:hypothetical protein